MLDQLTSLLVGLHPGVLDIQSTHCQALLCFTFRVDDMMMHRLFLWVMIQIHRMKEIA
jgi:hypothetical protein